MMIKFYGYKKCGTCRKAEKFLQNAGLVYEYIDITENPPSADELAVIARCADTPLNKFFNTSGLQYRELNIKSKLPTLSSQQILAILADNGRLIKRPLVTDGKRATLGFNGEKFRAVWQII